MDSIRDALDPSAYHRLPDDWLVALTDVRGSTENLRRGRYKEVNGVGVAAIAAIRNLNKPEEIPFVFGGDGATFCIPPERKEEVENILRATRQMATDDFDLELRIGIVPHRDIIEKGREVRVARLRLSEWVTQTLFLGGGLEEAEDLVKDDSLGDRYQVSEDGPSQADFQGLECRWENIPSRHGETVAYIFRAFGSEEERAHIFQRLVALIEASYGDELAAHPLHLNGMNLANGGDKLSVEHRVRTFGEGALSRWVYGLYLRLQIVVGKVIMKRGMTFAGADWSHYKEDLIRNADYRKIDDCLRFVLSGSAEQRGKLLAAVKEQFTAEELVWGHHVADSAIMTCVIDSYEHEHMHFVDGADGGYALAAKEMKAAMAKLGV